MFSLSRTQLRPAFLLALLLGFGFAAPQLNAQASSAQPEAPAADAPKTQAPSTVQARIKARREKRRTDAIHDVYTHLYEAYVAGSYLRFTPGQDLQRLNEFGWDVGVSRYYNERFGVTVDGRGTYGAAYVGPNFPTNTAIYKPKISQYAVMIGPTYRLILQPKYSLSGRVMGGGAFGNFSGDLGSHTPAQLGLWDDGGTFILNASAPFEYNVSPGLGLRVAPEYLATGFGSSIHGSLGFTTGIVVRFGRQ